MQKKIRKKRLMTVIFKMGFKISIIRKNKIYRSWSYVQVDSGV